MTKKDILTQDPGVNNGAEQKTKLINPIENIQKLKDRLEEQDLLSKIDLLMVVGSAGAVAEGIISPETREIKDIDTVTVTHSDEDSEAMQDFIDQNRDDLTLCNETSDVFKTQPLTGMLAEADGSYPIYTISHMLTWAKPHIIHLSEHFRTVLQEASASFLSPEQIEQLSDSYLVAIVSIGGFLEKDLKSLDVEVLKKIVDVATNHKAKYYKGEHDNSDIKTSVSLPGPIRNELSPIFEHLPNFTEME